ncbi:glycoside hydrolase family 25 protein [Algoriphagus pacificus]|uniref:Glycoside hydrolase family 25 protein n=1 Tax=Algoriphagus pacificus TaxID=2811234 RepID=A0ABS3CCM5_9BACT|nr:glycoside hydrolase family 25 protein [Algoriphagus pacificus]MBN7813916.1 glycoside hydrolase family 25 protein [Algoriphagus pacificus]
MPRKKSKKIPAGLILLLILLTSGAGYLIFTTWNQLHNTPYYANLPASEQEELKFDYVFKTQPEPILGIDISHYQGKIDWKNLELQIKDKPVQFFVFRATMGYDQDKLFREYWNALDTMNVIRGAYHYYRPNENSTKQAENFIKRVKLSRGDLRPILDIERHSTIQSKERLRTGIQNWLELVEAHYGVKPIIYTGDTFNRHVLVGNGFEDYPLWIANYNPVKHPESDNWVIWQFSEKGRMSGIKENVDLNLLRGGMESLETLRID